MPRLTLAAFAGRKSGDAVCCTVASDLVEVAVAAAGLAKESLGWLSLVGVSVRFLSCPFSSTSYHDNCQKLELDQPHCDTRQPNKQCMQAPKLD